MIEMTYGFGGGLPKGWIYPFTSLGKSGSKSFGSEGNPFFAKLLVRGHELFLLNSIDLTDLSIAPSPAVTFLEKLPVAVLDNLRIRPEQHPLKLGEIFCERHHGQHYHVEMKKPGGNWNNDKHKTKILPPGYEPGKGKGFLPGESFP
jgi:hypothetical protein